MHHPSPPISSHHVYRLFMVVFVAILSAGFVGCGIAPEDMGQPSSEKNVQFSTSSHALTASSYEAEMEKACNKAKQLAASAGGHVLSHIEAQAAQKRCDDMTKRYDKYVEELAAWIHKEVNAENQPCWKKTTTTKHSVGLLRKNCGSRKLIGAFCYEHCKSGYRDVGTACEKPCPSGYTDDGLFCRRPTKITNRHYYNRGRYRCKSGYHQTSTACYQPCKSGYSGVGHNCVRWAKTVWKHRYYQGFWGSCKAGYHRVAWDCYKKCGSGWKDTGLTCLRPHHQYRRHVYGRNYGGCKRGYTGIGGRCYQNCPSGFRQYWMNHGQCIRTLHSFAQERYVRGPHTATCFSHQVEDAGLCYECPNNYKPAGPICYENCPSSHSVSCGVGVCATTSGQCAEFIAKAVLNVFSVALQAFKGAKYVYKGVKSIKDAAKAAKAADEAASVAGGLGAIKAGQKSKAWYKRVNDSYKKAVKELTDIMEANVVGRYALKVRKKYNEVPWAFKKAAKLYAKRMAKKAIDDEMAKDTSDLMKDIIKSIDPTGIAALLDTFVMPKCEENQLPAVPSLP